MKHMACGLLVLLVLVAPTTAQSTGRIVGTVTAAGASLADAIVDAGGASATTASTGRYQLLLRFGTYVVTAHKAGFADQSKTVTLSSDTLRVDFALAPMSPPPAPEGRIPINDLGTGLYLGYQGGLYPGGSNVPPGAHHNEGLARAHLIQPLNANGNPSTSGKIVMISIGMSNASQEFCTGFNGTAADNRRSYWPNVTSDATRLCNAWTFMGQAWADPAVNHATLTIVDAAQPGAVAEEWANDAIRPDNPYDSVRNRLIAAGLSERQVQVVWMKHANVHKKGILARGFAESEAVNLEMQQGIILRLLQAHYPNLKMVFVSSRTYGGYSLDTVNPEPWAYESGFGAKWLVEDQITQMSTGRIDPQGGDLNYDSVAPWIAWGAYLWANGSTPRSDGLVWLAQDFDVSDRRHPSQLGEQKVGSMLLAFFKTAPYTCPWFLAMGC